MSQKAINTRPSFVPAPIDGLNLVDPPPLLQQTEARVLKNYFVYDFGIRQMGVDTSVLDPYTTNLVLLNSEDDLLFYCAENKLFKLTSPTSASPTDVTGGATITMVDWNSCYFNQRLFIFNGADTPLYHDFGSGNFQTFSATGPTVTTLKQGTGYKSRLYTVQKDSTVIWYGAVGAFSGTFTSFDVGTILARGNSKILCVFNWTYNQGDQNEELFCILSNRGEVLIYSGDYPAAPNWQLIVKAEIPLPGGFSGSSTGQPFAKVASDVYISTERGVVPLSTIIAGVKPSSSNYTLSRKIKDQIYSGFFGGAVDSRNPFIYFRDKQNSYRMYVMNYERGAWSLWGLNQSFTGGGLPISIINVAFFQNHIMIARGVANNTYGTLSYAALDPALVSANLDYEWRTGWSTFGSTRTKQIKHIRVIGTNYGEDGDFKNTVTSATDFIDDDEIPFSNKDSASTAVLEGVPTVQELKPPGVGRWISIKFGRPGTFGVDEWNEIYGFEIEFEQGGPY